MTIEEAERIVRQYAKLDPTTFVGDPTVRTADVAICVIIAALLDDLRGVPE